MGLTLVTGRANAGKSGVVHGALIEASARSQPVLVLPQVPDVKRVVQEFARKGILGVRPVVFDDWIEELWMLWGDGRRVVTDATRAAIVARAVEQSPLGGLAASASTAGFPRLFGDLLKRMTAPLIPAPQGLTADFAALIGVYSVLLDEAGLVESAEAAARLAESPPDPGGPVGVNRFTDLSPSQELLLVGLSRRTEVSVALTWEEGRAATEALDPLVRRLELAGARHVRCAETDWTEEGLAALEARLFEDGPPLTAPDGLHLGLSTGIEAECALAARVARTAVERGVEPQSIAIAFRDAGSRAAILAACLNAEGVPSAIDVSIGFAQTPYGAAFTALMDACSRRGDTRERLLVFLLSVYSGAEPEIVAEADRHWRRSRLPAEGLVDSAVKRLPAAAVTLRLAKTLLCRPRQRYSAQKWQELAFLLLGEASKRRGLTGGDGESDAAAHRALMRTVSDLSLVDPAVAGDDLVCALRALRVSTGRGEEEGRVLVTEAHRLRGRRFDTLILGGLSATEFSCEHREPLAARLASRLGQPPGLDTQLAERLLFYTMVSRARRNLVLIRQVSDERGEAMRPSAFWDEVLDLYRTPEQAAAGEMPRGVAVTRLSVSDLAAAAPALLPGRRALRAKAKVNAPVPPARGLLTHAEVLAGLAQREEFSVSEIEAYTSCPYHWFQQRVLRPSEIDAEYDARERGSLAHEILSAFYERRMQESRGRIRPEELDEALKVLDEVAGECAARPHRMASRGLEDELSAAKARDCARNIIEDDVEFLPEFTPARQELRFGSRWDRPVEFAGVRLSGSIDRVDVSARGLVVIDYKSSTQVPGKASFLTKGLVQVPVYAATAAALLELPALGGVYRSMKSLSVRGFWNGDEVDVGGRGSDGDCVDADGMARVIDEARVQVAEAVAGMREGFIAPRPRNAQACAYCDARAVCGWVR